MNSLGVSLVGREHELVPPHELLSDKEAKKILDELDIKPEQLPKMLESDPQAIKLGAKSGQIVAIHRKDSGKEYTYYRLVKKV